MEHRIILVDDDRNITASVSMALRAEGYNVESYNDGESGLKAIRRSEPNLVILDIKMPRMDGIEVITKLRQNSSVPVIFLTSKDDETDELVGLRLGADDYITKPFSQRLLLERIRAILRRQNFLVSSERPTEENQGVYEYGSLRLDDARHLSLWKGESVNLTVTEYLLLKALAIRPGVVKNRDQLIDIAYGESIFVDDRTIDSHIKRVRKKFKIIDNGFNQIETLYGVGYRYKETENSE